MRADGPIPAQLTTVRSGTPWDAATSTPSLTWEASVTSTDRYVTPSITGAFAIEEGRSKTCTDAPAFASARAVAAPSPEAPPVTIAEVSFTFMAGLSECSRTRGDRGTAGSAAGEGPD